MADVTTRTGIRDAVARLRKNAMLARIVPLGLAQIIGWGTTFYMTGVLGDPIATETGWSRALVFAGITLGLVVSSALSSWAGRAIDREGGARVMSLGVVAAAAGHVGLALARSEWAYLAAWALIGVAMRLTLYDAAFPALVQVVPPGRGRIAISYLTLFGGFASSVFWPVGHLLAGALGWRTTMWVYAGLDLIVCLPLIRVALVAYRPRPADAPVEAAAAAAHLEPEPPHAHLEGKARNRALLLFGTAMSLNSFVWGATMAHIVALLQSTGVNAGSAVALAALMGVAQVTARAWDTFVARGLSALKLGQIALAMLPFALLALFVPGPPLARALAFPILLGLTNGLATIVRGAVPLALFGSEGFGALLGRLAAPQLLMNAIAPMLFAALIERTSLYVGELVLLAGAVASSLAMEATIWTARHRDTTSDVT